MTGSRCSSTPRFPVLMRKFRNAPTCRTRPRGGSCCFLQKLPVGCEVRRSYANLDFQNVTNKNLPRRSVQFLGSPPLVLNEKRSPRRDLVDFGNDGSVAAHVRMFHADDVALVQLGKVHVASSSSGIIQLARGKFGRSLR